jgi:DNA-binding beta-propeller fold protein YncE
MPVLFAVYRFSPDGKLTWFGRPGSAPGRFGIVAGIACDSRGNLFVADKLKSVVMVFDKDFKFLTEFGYRGSKPGNLIVPDEVAIDKRDRVYVSQARKRGVSVFGIAFP